MNTNVNKRKKKKKKRINKFARFLICYSAVLAAAMVVCWIVLYGFIKDYEEGRPSSQMDKIISYFTADNVENLLNESSVKVNEFETNEQIAGYLEGKLGNETVTYRKKSREYSESTPVYVVYAGDTPIAKVSLVQNGKNSHNFTKWKMGSVSFDDYSDKSNNNTITISAPSDSKVMVNGIEVGDSYIKESGQEFSPCKHVGDYVEKPLRTVYEISGLVAQPQVEAELSGVNLEIVNENNTYTAEYPSDDDMLAEMQDDITSIARNYGKYIINRGSLSSLTSRMVGYANEYISDIPAVWAFLYGKTYTYEFNNENISNFRKYSDDCFSCDVYYDLYVDWKDGNKTYNTSVTYTFVKTDGEWYVADFIIN